MNNNQAGRARGRCALLALAAAGLWLATPAARAQNVNSGVSIGPSQALSPPSAPPAPTTEHLITQLDPLRQQLANYGVTVLLDWTSEVLGNPTGGVKQGATYAGQVGFEVDVDWDKLAGIPGLTTHTVIVNRQGSNDGTLAGDNLNQTQEIYGAGGNVLVHLVYAYAEESLLNGRVDIAVGRMPELNDFSASPLYCNFMNNSLCGNPKLLPSADIGLSSYPDAVWAGRVRVRPTPNTYIQAGIYEVNQGLYSNANFRTGFKFDTSQDSGVEFPIELAYEPVIGPDKLPGHYKIGFAHDTSDDLKFLTTVAGVRAGTGANHGQKEEWWALADQMVLRTGPGSTDGLILLAGYTHANPQFSAYTDQVFAAALLGNFWKARPADTIGLLFNYSRVSGALGKEQALDIDFGLPLANGATGIQTHQELIELNYDIHVYRGVNFEPDFQYYWRLNAQSNIQDAAFFGFKSHISF